MMTKLQISSQPCSHLRDNDNNSDDKNYRRCRCKLESFIVNEKLIVRSLDVQSE